MMRQNFFHFLRLQFSALSQMCWLYLICCIMYCVFFLRVNKDNPLTNVIILAAGFIMLSYMVMQNFSFNDAKYKTRLLFNILPVNADTIIASRAVILYFLCLAAAAVIFPSSYMLQLLWPDFFASVQINILPASLILAAICIPFEFLLFYVIEAPKSDIIGAFAIFPFMGLTGLMYSCLANKPLWIAAVILAAILNIFCFKLSARLYKSREC